MKKKSFCTNVMTINQKSSVIKNFTLLILLLCLTIPAYPQWVVQGRKLSWELTAPDGWIGGNYYQIENVERDLESQNIRQLLNEMKEEAKVLDAYLINTNVQGASPRILTSIRINVTIAVGSGADFSSLWNNLAYSFQSDHPSGSITRLHDTRSTITGGYNAKEAKYKTTLPGGGVIYEVVHVVLLGTDKGHLFKLKVNSAHYQVRYQEFVRMMKSLEYKND